MKARLGPDRTVASISAYGTHRLRQVLEERALALARTGDGQQVVTQALVGQEDRHTVPGMAGGADFPAMAQGKLMGGECCTGAGAFQVRQVGQVLRLRQVPQGRNVGDAEQVRGALQIARPAATASG